MGNCCMKGKKCCFKPISTIIFLIALVVAIISVVSSKPDSVIAIIRFFDVMIPILAVGALLKYMFTTSKKSCSGSGCSSQKMEYTSGDCSTKSETMSGCCGGR